MSNYRRAVRPGGTFFFTLVTHRRAPFLCEDVARGLLRRAIDDCRAVSPFEIDAFVLLPNHMHAMWTLPEGDADFSSRWMRIKRSFTLGWIAVGGAEEAISDARRTNRRRGVWQRRFWEHTIRDQADYERHLNYIHYNPIKHGLARCAHAWRWSSFHRLVSEGVYDPGWCCACDRLPLPSPDFGTMDTDAIETAFGE